MTTTRARPVLQIQRLLPAALALVLLSGCGRVQALINPPTPRPPAPTDFAPAVTVDASHVASVFGQEGGVSPTETPVPPALTETPTPLPPPGPTATPAPTATSAPTRTPAPTVTRTAAPILVPMTYTPLKSAQLRGFRYERQSFNNCGPATTVTLLSFYGRAETQVQAAAFMRPGKDDKNVSPSEITAFAGSLGLGGRVVVGGDLTLLRALISNGIPVIVESWFIPEPNDQMGHYLLLTGYDGEQLFFSDSYHGPDTRQRADEFDALWKVFNRLMIVVWKPEQAGLVTRLLGPRANDAQMLDLALARARAEIEANPQDPFAWFNAGSTLAGQGQFARAARAYDTARGLRLPWRMLWYQFGPYEAYFGAGEFDTVIRLATQTLSTTNGLEESLYWRGRAQQAQGRAAEAKADFEAALKENPNFAPARAALVK
ncbi:MAG: C39 family peptidase [Thermoflexales bacterium]|nr:C39 family peptidase [Thermoflexales bacterium]